MKNKSITSSLDNENIIKGNNRSFVCSSQSNWKMKLLEEVKNEIIRLGGSKAAGTLAHAAASACNQKYGVSLLRICSGLDYSNKQLVLELLDITKQPDFSNSAQDEMLSWLEVNEWLSRTPTHSNF